MESAATPVRGVSVELTDVGRAFADPSGNASRVVIERFSLRIDAGEFLAILGPSGCGKSTLLRMIAGLLPPDQGRIDLGPDAQKFQTSFVFQDAHLLPWRTVLENAALPLELMGGDLAERLEKAQQALARVGLADACDLYPAQLSGGMKMRVSLARALSTRPRLLLLDEPFAALDEITRFKLDLQLRELWSETGMTVIFVTHSISEAAFLANRAVVLSRRGGHIRLDRRLKLPDRTEDLRLDPRYMQEMSLLLRPMEEE